MNRHEIIAVREMTSTDVQLFYLSLNVEDYPFLQQPIGLTAQLFDSPVVWSYLILKVLVTTIDALGHFETG